MEECSSDQKCCSNHQKCSCPCHSKEHYHEEGQHEECAYDFLEAADCAWMEVLKDKIKEYILSTQNDRMTELAKIVAEANNQRWRHKMEKKQGCMDFKEKLCNFFSKQKK